jgi:F-type H+-transporting ATPase subunit epsilon
MSDAAHPVASSPHEGRLSLQIVTPAGAQVGHPVDEVIAPGTAGEFGVLPGHVPFLSALRSGVLSYRDGASRVFLAVGAGFLQVGAGDQVTVLCSRTQVEADIDEAEASADERAALDEVRAADQALAADQARAADPSKAERAEGLRAERAAAEENLAWARARLEAKARAAEAKLK